MFQITGVYSDNDGDSYFEDLQVPMEHAGDIGYLSAAQPVASIIFREVLPAYDYDFHTAPQKQYIILLDGAIEIETSRGEKRIFKAGEVLLVADTTGKGHKTRNVQAVKRRSIFIILP